MTTRVGTRASRTGRSFVTRWLLALGTALVLVGSAGLSHAQPGPDLFPPDGGPHAAEVGANPGDAAR